MFKVRSFVPEDYAQYSQWLAERGRLANALENLPKVGSVIYDDEDDYAIGFLLDSGTKQCSMGCFASSPYADEKKRSESIGLLIDHFIQLARDNGYQSIFMATNREKLLDRLMAKGFTVHDVNLTQVGRAL